MLAFPKYESYQDSGVDWLGEIPRHWAIAKLKWITKRYAGGTPDRNKPEYWEQGNIPWISSGEVNQDLITKPTEYITEKGFKNSSARWVSSGSLVIALAGQGKTKGTVAQVAINTTCNQSLAAIIPKKIKARYLYYWLKYNYQTLRGIAGDGQRDGLNLETIGSLPVAIPNIEEQIKIAEFLDRKTSEIDQAIAQKQRLIELLQEQKAILINQAVTKGLNPNIPMRDSGIEWLGDIPEHWQVTRLKRLFLEIDDRSTDGSEILLSLRMYAGLVPHDDVSDKPIEDASLVGYKRVYPGQIVMNRMRAAIGLFGVASIFGIVSPDYAIFRQIKDLRVDYYLNLFKTELMKKEFLLESKGLGTGSSGFLRLYSDKFGMIKVPFPPLDEQTQILNHIQKINKEFSKALENAEQEIDLLKELKDIVISQAVTGKIKV